MVPMAGPPRCTLTYTMGRRALAQKLMPSLMRLMPQELELVMARVPVPAAP